MSKVKASKSKFHFQDVVSDTKGSFTEDGSARLMAYLGRVAKGQPNVYETSFAKGESTQAMLSAWKETLVSISDEWPSLWQFEEDLSLKVGPMSVMRPIKDRLDDLDHYYADILLPAEPVNPVAMKAVISEFSGVRGLTLRSQQMTTANMRLSTNSGAPYFSRRRLVLPETILCKVHYTDDRTFSYLTPTRKTWSTPAVIGWRGQEGGIEPDDVKQRIVWMFPFSVNICELQVYQPLIEGCQKHNLVPAWVSMDAVDKAVTDLFDTKDPNDSVVCTDFSRFDQHFGPVMQECSETILRAILRDGDSERQWMEHVFPIKYNIPLVYDGFGDLMQMSEGAHGMASGSGGTNCDETLVHRALQYEAAIMHQSRLNPHSQCLGDDGILTYPGITVDDVVRTYSSHGQEMNPDKQYVSTTDCVYLRRWHHTNYRPNGVCAGVYSTCRALGRLRYLERFMDPAVWGPTMQALRQLSILENVKFHPLKELFVQFCMKRDKYRLGIDIPGFLDHITSYAQEANDYMPGFLSYTQSQMSGSKGIADWWIVSYLKSLS